MNSNLEKNINNSHIANKFMMNLYSDYMKRRCVFIRYSKNLVAFKIKGVASMQPFFNNLNLMKMKIEIFGRHIEIDDAKVNEVFEKKYKQYEHLDMDKDELIQRGLDYFEYSLEYNILLALGHCLGTGISVLQHIADYKHSVKVSPFNKPWNELRPNNIPKKSLSQHDTEFLQKLGHTKDRDDDIIENIYKAEEEKERKIAEKVLHNYIIEWGLTRKNKKKTD